MNYKTIKRNLDLFLVIIFSPLIVLLAFLTSVLIFFDIGRPILFFQSRIGFSAREFKIVKFRTMTNEKDKSGELLPDSRRVSRIGKLIRKLSLDELPSFLNVLNGDMSIVGPRPFVAKYKNLYTKKQNRRHEVKPGITGLAQVNGRNNLSWEEKFEFDVHYVKNQSFLLDLNILFKTVLVLILKRGINQDKGITMQEFKGTNDL